MAEVRICPLGPPQEKPRPVAYAYCAECRRVRKNTRHCPMIEQQDSDGR